MFPISFMRHLDTRKKRMRERWGALTHTGREVSFGSISDVRPGYQATSVARGRADGISTKADVGLKCRLLGVERTYLGHGRIVCL